MYFYLFVYAGLIKKCDDLQQISNLWKCWLVFSPKAPQSSELLTHNWEAQKQNVIP